MENDMHPEFHKIKNESLLKINNRDNKTHNKLELEENKININSRNYLFDNKDIQNKYNNLLLNTNIRRQLRPINKNYSNYNINNTTSRNQTLFQNPQKSINEIPKDILNIKKYHFLSRNTSHVKKRNKKFNFNRLLLKNKSTSAILNKNTQELPLIKPRRILINICSGPYEFKITDLNKKYYSYKQFGKNSFFMGEKYNPENYGIPEKTKTDRNYYGAIYSN